MFLPILCISPGQILVSNHKQVFGVLLFRRPGEIERAGDHRFPVNNHDLGARDRMGSIYLGKDPGMGQKISLGILFPSLAFIQDDLHLNSSFVGIELGFANGGGGKDKAKP